MGTIFELAHGSGTITTLVSANASTGNLFLEAATDAAGDLYGRSYISGAPNTAIFELVKGSTVPTTLAYFNGPNNAAVNALIADSSGNLFGATANNGANGDGAVFELAKNSSVIAALANFDDTDGTLPPSVVVNSTGDIFGVTANGGSVENVGTAFEVVHGSGVVTTVAIFNGPNGSEPAGDLVIDSAGDIYGVTNNGGANNLGPS